MAHAAVDLSREDESVACWHSSSNVIVSLCVPDEASLSFLQARLAPHVPVTEFREEDLGFELTAIAVILPPGLRHLVSSLPLALRGVDPVQDRTARRREGALRELMRAGMSQHHPSGMSRTALAGRSRLLLRDLARGLRDEVSAASSPAWLSGEREALLDALPSWLILEKFAVLSSMGDSPEESCAAWSRASRHLPDQVMAAQVSEMLSVPDPSVWVVSPPSAPPDHLVARLLLSHAQASLLPGVDLAPAAQLVLSRLRGDLVLPRTTNPTKELVHV